MQSLTSRLQSQANLGRGHHPATRQSDLQLVSDEDKMADWYEVSEAKIKVAVVSAAMKTITVLKMMLLPATFVDVSRTYETLEALLTPGYRRS